MKSTREDRLGLLDLFAELRQLLKSCIRRSENQRRGRWVAVVDRHIVDGHTHLAHASGTLRKLFKTKVLGALAHHVQIVVYIIRITRLQRCNNLHTFI